MDIIIEKKVFDTEISDFSLSEDEEENIGCEEEVEEVEEIDEVDELGGVGENLNIVSTNEKQQKKRGRKPKDKVIEDEKIPKKRGRKPKEKVYSVKELPKSFYDENKNETLILHLPIKMIKDTENKYISSSNEYSYYNEEIHHNDNLMPTQMNLLETVENHDTYESSSYELKNVNDINKDGNRDGNKDGNAKEVQVYKNIENSGKYNEEKQNKVIKKNLKNIMYEFIHSNKENVWPEKTNIYCWWCCHSFSNTPCCLPEYYKNGKFYVYGVFCSFNCSASYNFSKNDEEIWERYSLLNLMYKKLYNEKFVKIKLAPPREVLKIFGGYLSIDEFRENLEHNSKIFNLIYPPLECIIPKVEESILNNRKNCIVNENILNKTHSQLKLKRSKPITNPNNTLQSFMDLKIV